MASNHVILDSHRPPTPETRTTAATDSVRPKAFRRPPGWIAPPGSPYGMPAPSRRPVTAATGPAAVEEHPPRAHEKLYGISLIALVIGINLLAGFLLSAWNRHIAQHHPAARQSPAVIAAPASPAVMAERVTLYASPPEERRTLRIERLDMPIDSTDAIELPPANPADDR